MGWSTLVLASTDGFRAQLSHDCDRIRWARELEMVMRCETVWGYGRMRVVDTYTLEDERLEHTAITHEKKGTWSSKPPWGHVPYWSSRVYFCLLRVLHLDHYTCWIIYIYYDYMCLYMVYRVETLKPIVVGYVYRLFQSKLESFRCMKPEEVA